MSIPGKSNKYHTLNIVLFHMLIVNQTFHEFTSIKISIKLPYCLYKFTFHIKMRKNHFTMVKNTNFEV